MDIHGILFCIFVVASCLSIPLLRRQKLFDLSHRKYDLNPSLAIVSPLIALLLYLLSFAFIPVSIEKLLLYSDMHGYSSFSNPEMKNLAQLVALVSAACLLILFSFFHPKKARALIWGPIRFRELFRFIAKGVCICVLLYPPVMLFVQCIHFVIEKLTALPANDQIALVQLKNLRNNPWLFWTFVTMVVTVVPVLEELLFRGFFQNYFITIFGKLGAVFTTSVIFTGFHYASQQGITNIELLSGLFVFSFMIGIVYLKFGSLFAAISMHATFNALSVVLMLFLS